MLITAAVTRLQLCHSFEPLDMHSRLSTLSQGFQRWFNPAEALSHRVQQKRIMTASNPVHAPRAGKVGGPLVSGETTAEQLDRAKGQSLLSVLSYHVAG